eukprot:SAG31_NODE_8100_length_1523_cov_2.241573_1_plen_39_part_00
MAFMRVLSAAVLAQLAAAQMKFGKEEDDPMVKISTAIV